MSKEWKLVPVEPTDDMKEAGAPSCEYTGTVCAALCYETMIAAAPEAPHEDPVAYANPKSFANFKNLSHLGGHYTHEWMWANPAPGLTPLYARSDAGEVDRLNTVVEQQKNLIASLRAELRDSYSIDAAVQEEHLDLEAAAKKLAACMDYPWEHMPEQGRASMREHATAVIGAALNPAQSGASA